jgi:O-antigen/teichoic acid export membrane protein
MSLRSVTASIHTLFQRPFFRNVAVVASGTAIAQAITVATSPLLTRLYGPEAFGILSVFISVTSIIITVSHLSLPYAIVLPFEDEDGARLIWISIWLTFAFGLVITGVLAVTGEKLVDLVGIHKIGWYSLLIPIVVLLSNIRLSFDQWLTRKKRFKNIVTGNIGQSIIANGGMAAYGLISATSVTLIGVMTLSYGARALIVYLASAKDKASLGIRSFVFRMPDTKTINLLYDYRDFPIYRTPQTFLNSMSSSLPVMLLASLSGPAAAGFYAIGHRVLKLPSTLISESMRNVFYQRITEAAHKQQNLRLLLLKATGGLAAIGFAPMMIIAVFGPSLFAFVFGAEWVVAGEYARWMAIWIFFALMNVPSVVSIPVLSLQSYYLGYEILTTTLRVTTLVAGLLLFENEIVAIIAFSTVGALMNGLLIIFVIFQSNRRVRSSIVATS